MLAAVTLAAVAPEELGRQLRGESSAYLARRRAIVGLSLAAMGSLGVVALYQTGVIAHLPDPPLPSFDADKVHGSSEAYAMLGVPDAALGLCSYAATLALAAVGGEDRTMTRPWLPLALTAKVAFDVLQVCRLTAVEAMRLHAFSIWSVIPASATCATAALAFPEARAAVRRAASIRWIYSLSGKHLTMRRIRAQVPSALHCR